MTMTVRPSAANTSLAAAALLLATGCDGSDEISQVTGDTQPPVISSLELRVNPKNHLSYFLDLDTDEPTLTAVDVTDDAGRRYPVRVPAEPGKRHELRIVGLRANHTLDIAVSATDAAGNTSGRLLTAATGPLPADIPPVAPLIWQPDGLQPGFTIFPFARVSPAPEGQSKGGAVAVDEEGVVVWYLLFDSPLEQLTQLGNGHFGLLGGELLEVDVMGTVVHSFVPAELGLVALHHDFERLPSGNTLALSAELRTITGYGGGGVTYDVVGDVVVELSPERTIVSQHSLFEVLDPLDVTLPSFNLPFWDPWFPEATNGTKDWTHANDVLLDPDDDTVLVSLRHLNAIIKLDRVTGELKWRLGEGGDFELAAGGEHFFHQHAPVFTGEDRLLIYDNGNYRSTTPDGEPDFTRVVEYQITDTGPPDQWKVEQLWEYRGPEPYFAPMVGSVRQLGNGNVLICDGGRVADPTLAPFHPANDQIPRIIEVSRTGSPGDVEVVVFELGIGSAVEPTSASYVIARAERIATLDAAESTPRTE